MSILIAFLLFACNLHRFLTPCVVYLGIKVFADNVRWDYRGHGLQFRRPAFRYKKIAGRLNLLVHHARIKLVPAYTIEQSVFDAVSSL